MIDTSKPCYYNFIVKLRLNNKKRIKRIVEQIDEIINCQKMALKGNPNAKLKVKNCGKA